jgi:hypothetical protein
VLAVLVHAVKVELRIAIQKWLDVHDGDGLVVVDQAQPKVDLAVAGLQDGGVAALMLLLAG